MFGGEFPKEVKEIKKVSARKEKYRSEESIVSVVLQIRNATEDNLEELGKLTKEAIQLNYNEALGWCYFVTAEKYLVKNQPQIAIQYAQLADQAGGPNQLQKHILLVELYSLTGAFDKSNSLALQVRNYKSIADKEKCKIQLILADNYIGLESYQKALESLEEFNCNYEDDLNNQYNAKMAVTLISLGKAEEGVRYYNLSKNRNSPSRRKNLKIADEKKEVSEALKRTSNYSLDVEVLSDVTYNWADTIIPMQQLLLATSYFELQNMEDAWNSISNFKAQPDFDLIDHSEIAVIKSLANHYAQRNQEERAIELYQFYLVLADSIHQNIKDLKNPQGLQNLLELETLRKEQELTRSAMQQLMVEDELKGEVLTYSRWAIILLSVLIVFGLIGGYFILKSSKERRIANMQLALRSLRTQMNPHFIFNALNSVNSFISDNDQLNANKYLTSFSKLMRLVMENSEHDFITLSKELEIIRLYLYLEHHRFKNQFEYSLEVDEEIDEEHTLIPPMLVQPYIENAVWHGLRYKEELGHLKVSFKQNTDTLIIEIADDGIGRKKSAEMKTKHQKQQKSVALKNIQERLSIIKDLNKVSISVTTVDLNEDGTGTKVKLEIRQNI
jgi:tetratricopeptide (TPR) repeat protein